MTLVWLLSRSPGMPIRPRYSMSPQPPPFVPLSSAWSFPSFWQAAEPVCLTWTRWMKRENKCKHTIPLKRSREALTKGTFLPVLHSEMAPSAVFNLTFCALFSFAHLALFFALSTLSFSFDDCESAMALDSSIRWAVPIDSAKTFFRFPSPPLWDFLLIGGALSFPSPFEGCFCTLIRSIWSSKEGKALHQAATRSCPCALSRVRILPLPIFPTNGPSSSRSTSLPSFRHPQQRDILRMASPSSSAYASSDDEGSFITPAPSTASAPASTSYRPIAPLPPSSSTSSNSKRTRRSSVDGSGTRDASSVAHRGAITSGDALSGDEEDGEKATHQIENKTSTSKSTLRHALPPKPSTSYGPSSNGSVIAVPVAPKRVRVDSSLVPQAPKVPKTQIEKGKTPHLIVVLEQACLESYKISSGSSSAGSGGQGGSNGARKGKDPGAEKYALLNCDDHQRVLAKMGRDIAEARPDITHQVRDFACSSSSNK